MHFPVCFSSKWTYIWDITVFRGSEASKTVLAFTYIISNTTFYNFSRPSSIY